MKFLGATALLFGFFVSNGFRVGLAYTKGSSLGRGFGGSTGIGGGNDRRFPFEIGSSTGTGGLSGFDYRSGSGLGSGLTGRSGRVHSVGFTGSRGSEYANRLRDGSGSWLSGAFGGSSGPAGMSGFGGSSIVGLVGSYPRRYGLYVYHGTHTPWVYGVEGSILDMRRLLAVPGGVGSLTQSEKPRFGSQLGYGTELSQGGFLRGQNSHRGSYSGYSSESSRWGPSLGRQGISNRGPTGGRSSSIGFRGIFDGSNVFGGQSEGHSGGFLPRGHTGRTDPRSSFGGQFDFSSEGQRGGALSVLEATSDSSRLGGFHGNAHVGSLSYLGSYGRYPLNLLRRLQSRRLRKHYRRYLRRRSHGGILYLIIRIVSRRSGSYRNNLRELGGPYGSHSSGRGSYLSPRFSYFTYGHETDRNKLRSASTPRISLWI